MFLDIVMISEDHVTLKTGVMMHCETRAQTPAVNSEKPQGSIFLPLFQFKVHQTNFYYRTTLQSSSHVNLIYIYIYIYEIGYCYEDRR